MKKIFSILAVFALIMISCTAQDMNVPAAVKKAFHSKFPGAKQIKWSKENKNEFEMEFVNNGNEMSANFDNNGNWVKIETVINEADIPVVVKNSVLSKYPEAIFITTEKAEQPNKAAIFEVIIKTKSKKKELELSEDGSFI